MSVRVKICGVNGPEAYAAAAGAGADWVGFVFFPPSPRFVTPAQAAALARPGGPPRVGLFVQPSDDEVAAAADAAALDVLQVYASAERARALRARFGRPVWRAVGVEGAADLPRAMDGADALLLDAKPPRDATLPGGNALRFDWGALRGWAAPGPWVLAGGLDPESVAEAVRETGAPVVDVSSGVERARGVKDAGMIRRFVEAARGV